MSEEPYFVEVDRVGCSTCGRGIMWTVIGPDGSQHSESWGSEEEAANFSECMNEAYANGRASALSPQTPVSEPESRSIQPTFTLHRFVIAELRAAIDEVGRMPHVLPCSVYVSCRAVGAPEECTCYKSQRLATLHSRLAELEKKAEEKP